MRRAPERHGTIEDALADIGRRLEQALSVQRRILAAVGYPVDAVLAADRLADGTELV